MEVAAAPQIVEPKLDLSRLAIAIGQGKDRRVRRSVGRAADFYIRAASNYLIFLNHFATVLPALLAARL